ncbi:MAG: hypothetical protein KAZ88_03710 [Acidimicrobiia bacterium]|jgi:hypothetical protein|nr:hypothetical protein [Acidimicrobiia bacterium]
MKPFSPRYARVRTWALLATLAVGAAACSSNPRPLDDVSTKEPAPTTTTTKPERLAERPPYTDLIGTGLPVGGQEGLETAAEMIPEQIVAFALELGATQPQAECLSREIVDRVPTEEILRFAAAPSEVLPDGALEALDACGALPDELTADAMRGEIVKVVRSAGYNAAAASCFADELLDRTSPAEILSIANNLTKDVPPEVLDAARVCGEIPITKTELRPLIVKVVQDFGATATQAQCLADDVLTNWTVDGIVNFALEPSDDLPQPVIDAVKRCAPEATAGVPLTAEQLQPLISQVVVQAGVSREQADCFSRELLRTTSISKILAFAQNPTDDVPAEFLTAAKACGGLPITAEQIRPEMLKVATEAGLSGEKATCVVDQILATVPVPDIVALAEKPPTKLPDSFIAAGQRCGVSADAQPTPEQIRPVIVEVALGTGIAQAQASCLADDMLQTMPLSSILALGNGPVTELPQPVIAAMYRCGAVPPIAAADVRPVLVDAGVEAGFTRDQATCGADALLSSVPVNDLVAWALNPTPEPPEAWVALVETCVPSTVATEDIISGLVSFGVDQGLPESGARCVAQQLVDTVPPERLQTMLQAGDANLPAEFYVRSLQCLAPQ